MSPKFNFVAPTSHWDMVAESDDPYRYIRAGVSREQFETEQVTIWNWLSPLPDDIVLDVGCGIGRIARWVVPHARKYIGLDSSQSMLRRAKEYNRDIPNCEFLCADTLTVLPPASVDAVVCEALFIHLVKEQQTKYLHEMKEVLKPTGQAGVQIPKFDRYENGMTEEEVMSCWHGQLLDRDAVWVLLVDVRRMPISSR